MYMKKHEILIAIYKYLELQVDECSVKEAYNFAKKYLNEYNQIEKEQFGSNIDEVVNVFSKCSFADWKNIINNI